MYRHLSKLLILIVLVIAPVSFSSQEISDFAPECHLVELYRARLTAAAVDGSRQVAAAPPASPQDIPAYQPARADIARQKPEHAPSFGRPPPA